MTAKGDRIRLIHTDDPHTKLKPGAEGTVTLYWPGDFVQVGVQWDDGSTLGMIPGYDRWEIIETNNQEQQQ